MPSFLSLVTLITPLTVDCELLGAGTCVCVMLFVQHCVSLQHCTSIKDDKDVDISGHCRGWQRGGGGCQGGKCDILLTFIL